jgi:hypothetical protein
VKIKEGDRQTTKPQQSNSSRTKSRESNSPNRSENQPLEVTYSRTLDVMKHDSENKLVTYRDLSKEKQRSVRSRSIPEKIKLHNSSSTMKRRASSPARGSAAKKRADSKHDSSKDIQFRKTDSLDNKQTSPTAKVQKQKCFLKFKILWCLYH